ncbi:sugar transferase [Roseiconus lacunae]|uniref:Sugar transferase n=1 Tax=Roseiconus lacunae TaxID=2605694 RepID=A0ABT7PQW4_9BACT|nr:sugar transferase [Roseiconus lacunae]MDM4018861.1 sugar transferase [Roseiconus lacunae]
MLDYVPPNDDDRYQSDEDSTVSTVIRGQVGLDNFETHSASSGKKLARARARYFRRKYFTDRLIATTLFVVSGPVIAMLIVLVRSTSKGPGIYKQKRLGLHGKEFNVYKLRSMRIDAEANGKPVWCTKNDSRITRVGAFLRKTHLDELPQLWNVMRGDMSLTGPRPERPEICEKLAVLIDGYYSRNAVRPGVTGLAQINLEPDQTVGDVRRKQFLDLNYIENASFALDAKMLMATLLRVIGIRGGVAMKMLGLCRLKLVRECVEPRAGDDCRLFAIQVPRDPGPPKAPR